MGSVNLNKGLEIYKGKILGFTKNGFAVYPEHIGLNAIDTCECCGKVIHSQLSDADFCPLCAITLGIIKLEQAKEICDPYWKSSIDRLDKDNECRLYYFGMTEGFKAGIKYGVKNAYVSINGILDF